MPNKTIIGKEEWCSLPELNLPALKARVDSGAKTSSLHAFNINPFVEDGIKYVKFDIHPVQGNRKIVQKCVARAVDRRSVKSSSGEKQTRHVIKTPIILGDKKWDIEITLTNRDSMGYRMLLGREAMTNELLIDPNTSFCLGIKNEKDVCKHYNVAPVKIDRLKIGLLASNPDLYSNKRIMEAGEQRGHDMYFINVRQSYMNISSSMPDVLYRGGESLKDFDAIIPRIRPSATFYGCAVVRQFESMGVYCLNKSVSISRSRDKLRSLQLLAAKGIDMPMTGFTSSPLDTKEIIKSVGGAPLVVKLLEGTQGRGVVLAETSKAAESVINAFKSLRANILVQEFIKEAQGKDIRCFVIDGKVVGAMQRQAAEGEFRANLHLGGTADSVKITAEEKRIAIKAAKAMHLDVSGVDIIRSSSGPKVLEINSSPGLEGIEEVTGKDIAGLMIKCIEKSIDKSSKLKLDDAE
ncbi:MAG: 30S ribosomal protein S6--L-glutamate ligase [Rickettsiales bacterium]|nr:30S ribosomal protein S6--L-glutamate ligase [Pseudomonadota bacterium]MDA0966224.1 30S ribosomal protein S6--L-glutamate ligase [Pseudomonadota bacterium]MDG4543111.1 30S ribosomal protein S6--L-glutamate ligase [Rickettsiales bacterium]MDG4545309.1 30S ribosomal protein S6--L-glutamate ligase [Rickettsiales bacterium]MDG4547758.1 30S ribosomal protein S6--L-glutamate ligase [Rickettsiales bacterium]